MSAFRFHFEDNLDVVALANEQPFGPWPTQDAALDALEDEFLTRDPAQLCYVLLCDGARAHVVPEAPVPFVPARWRLP